MKKIVLVQGNFDILHPGHIRLLNFAKECGTELHVAVNSDLAMDVTSRVKEKHRLEMVQSLECVDHAFLTDLDSIAMVKELKPAIVVKGKEFEEQYNPEEQVLKAINGKLIFGSGEFESNPENFIRKSRTSNIDLDFNYAKQYIQRHNFSLQSLLKVLEKTKNLNVIVIGEVIVDEYVQGTAVGLSQEDPTIVMTPNKVDTFLGGAAITAGHIKSIGAQHVSLISVIGEDKTAEYVKSEIHAYQLESHLFQDNSRPTSLKTRYRAGSKTLLRVNQVRQHKISIELQNQIFEAVEEKIAKANLLVFSDFNYGILPQKLVDKITALCKEHCVTIVADSQTSSQVGDISRYVDMDLVTPTEREVRVALSNPDDGLIILAQKLASKSRAKNVVITLAEEGILIHIPNSDFSNWENDRLPAFNKHALDPAGAGDCFFAASSLALAANASPWQAFYIGNIAAACQVASVGNSPLIYSTLEKAITRSFI
ncbi:PfkB family carbohydrate kinase [Pseudoalteromonas sp. DL2-H2.2]|uniref:PfkB family carbohydrate kinase n=1 Tax=Pseudoalteromonas sp. DL2-H2.2 TaxID=2908889 RepID=UPI001F16B0CF|nr:PfkB family carbohydrate kinase [Pseudoalteromonas sp. DL2-H2.2]MCF2909715.1 PfkB family carbohydrate kinase [Pseudoalteromonas sp. DL2-H2.2]